MKTLLSAALASLVPTVVTASESGQMVSITGDYGYTQYKVGWLTPGTTIDARNASFTLANSRNAHPDSGSDCKRGSLPLNRYPVSIRRSPRVRLIGGTVKGKVPQSADWLDTYCNSAAIGIRESPNATVQAVRVHRSWDAIRFSKESPDFILTGSWISNARDDCVENDQLKSGIIRDTLFDGCFYGISMDPARNLPPASSTQEIVVLDRVIMKMTTYLARGRHVQGVPFKAHPSSPRLRIFNSVFAFDHARVVGLRRLARAWNKTIECENNLILWMVSAPLPTQFPPPPKCFRILKGDEAMTLWARLRNNWINCHPDIDRLQNDPISRPENCRKELRTLLR